MKKKLIAILMVAALAVTAVVGGTMAYFTDTDGDVNVMTLGNISIKQVELERGENGELQDYTQGKPLLPSVGERDWADGWQEWPTGGSSALYDDSLKNVIDKFVFVENDGSNDAYVRTWFAFEAGSLDWSTWDGLMHFNINATHWDWAEAPYALVEIDGVNYYVTCATYIGNAGTDGKTHEGGILPAGETTRPSLLQVDLDYAATQEQVASFGDTYEILVFSQAVQTAGFADPESALNTAFGTDHPWTDAGSGVTTYTGEMNALTISGDGAYILNDVAITSDSGNAITVAEGVDAQIVILGESTLTGTNGIYVSEGASVKISGTGSLTAIGKAGNGIGSNGTIEIAGLAALTAEGNGSHAYGIGGDGVESISISNTTINSVVGGCDGEEGTDKSYYKDAPEGGAAIGSGLDGAVINLNDVHVIKAVGGSKSAGIGASYWASVTVNIDNCQIDYVEGGVTAAGIGGSRIHDGDETTTINISNSTITKAVGGTFAAGIGSGYDSYCHVYGEAPICTINISGSTVEAWGGDNAAGIGTGYHAGGLDGVITGDVTGHAGENLKSYPDADAIGFGVLDPSRDGKDNACSISVNGVVITYGE